MTHEAIKNELARLITNERRNTNEFLIMLKEAEDRRSYAHFEYRSLFDWLTRFFKYPQGCAQRRLEAVRLMQVVPEVQARLEQGDLTLTNMNKAQVVIRAQEKATGEKISNEMRAEAIKEVENKTIEEAEKALYERFPEALPEVKTPRKRKMKNGITQITFNCTEEEIAELTRVQEMLSHKLPGAREGDTYKHLVKEWLKKDPLRKTTSAAEVNRINKGTPSKAHVRRTVVQSTEGCCLWVLPDGSVCGVRFQIQNDHIIPLGMGGEDTRENMRPLCSAHNFIAAAQAFGEEYMAKYRRKPKQDE